MQIIRDLVNKALEGLKLGSVDPSTSSGQGYSVTHPKEESHGDYSVNVAMILAKQLGKNPREVASEIMSKIQELGFKNQELVEKLEVAGPGFINFYLKPEFFLEETKKATQAGYGKNINLAGKKVMLE